MLELSRYQLSEQLHESANSRVYRAKRLADGQPVVVKVLSEEFPSPERIARFAREFEVAHGLNPSSDPAQALQTVVASYALERDRERWVMEVEDFGAESLARSGLAGRIGLEDFLEIAAQIARALAGLHARHVIHKDVNPSNVVLNPETYQVKLIDFGISTQLSRERTAMRSPGVLEGTLTYISPEQTGRTNRAVDYRTDFYSLGVTLYELLTGEVPFTSEDPLQLVHEHIARLPRPPHELRPGVPPLLSRIVTRLLEKNAEDRYQSGLGLAADLERCLEELRARGEVGDFALGQRDVSDRFQLPGHLYGRDREIASLLAAFERVGQGATELLLIGGYSGIGKSALVREVYRPITERRGYFILGKFDQLQREVPYAVLIQAFRSLARQLLTEGEASVASWRARLLAALGPNGRVITDVIPEFELLLGPQPEVPQLGPAEAENRFNLVFQSFVDVFAQPEHPLVIFLDDLQWADPASLSAVESLARRPGGHLLLIGAYRDNEVDEAHPLTLTLSRVRAARPERLSEIVLEPLAEEDVRELVADTVGRPAAEAEPLAHLAWERTGGNPFFLGGFLESLHAEGLLAFARGAWRWDLDRIRAEAITENVVDLLAGRIQRLSPDTQSLLQLAACLGNRFDLATLAMIAERPAVSVAHDLWEGVVSGLVLPLSDAYKLMALEVEGLAAAVSAEYRFAHDRVQQAVYSLIPAEERPGLHLRVGRLLLESTPPALREERIFAIVNQLDEGAALISDPDERGRLARLNLRAAEKAKASAAFPAAFAYLRHGLSLLDEDAWDTDYELALELHASAAEAAHLCREDAERERHCELVLEHARARLDRIRICELRVFAYNQRNEYSRAIETALAGLRLLGTELREDLSPAEVEAGFGEAIRTLLAIDPAEVPNLPRMQDPEQLATVRLLVAMTSTVFNSRPQLLADMAITIVRLAHEHGLCAELAYGFGLFGIVTCANPATIPAGYHAGKLAQRIQDTFGAQELKAKTYCMVNAFIRHWSEPMLACIEPFQEGLRSGLEQGDLEYASYCAKESCAFWLFGGVGLERTLELQTEAIGVLERIAIVYTLHNANVWRQLTLNLRGEGESRTRLVGEAFDEDALTEFLVESKHATSLFALYVSKAILCYLFGEPAEALRNVALAEEWAAGGAGLMHSGPWHFYVALIHLALCEPEAPEEWGEHLEVVERELEALGALAERAPSNYAHKRELVAAERARLAGEEVAAIELYEAAIDLAREHGFIHQEALAFELASRFHGGRGRLRLALVYLQDAHYAYRQWGALEKVADLEERYPQLAEGARSTGSRPGTSTSKSTRGTGSSAGVALDFDSVAKASQAISGEVVRADLLRRMMEIVVENAAAARGALVLATDEGPRLEVLAEGETRVLPPTPLSESLELSAGIVEYVLRTGEEVVLGDAASRGPFVRDAYVKRTTPRSILCAPIAGGGRTRGAIYLENNVAADAFTAERVRVIQLLSSQAAISLENAKLFAQLERANETLEAKVRARTYELEEKNDELQATLAQVREMQEQIVTQQKLASLSALTAGIAHEIRNPLNFIVNFADLSRELADELRAALDAAQLEEEASQLLGDLRVNVERIHEHGRRADQIIQMMAKHSQIYPYTREAGNLSVLVEDCLRTSQSEAGPLRIARDYEPIAPVEGVVGQALSGALSNLLDNARWAMREREGEPGYEPALEVSIRDVDEGVELRLRDNGVGIEAGVRERVLEPFFTTKPPGEGAGLGLSLAHEIVTKLHQGALELTSEPGRFTEVRLVIPRRAAPPLGGR